MRVVCITPMYPEVNNPRFGSFVEQQNRALEALGVEVTVLRRRDGARGLGSYLDLGARGIARIFELRRADIIHAHYAGVAAAEALALARLAGRPLVLTCHGSDVEAVAWRRPAVAALLHGADGLHFVSEALRQQAKTLVGAWRAPTLVQPTGVELQRYAARPRPMWQPNLGRPLTLLAVGLLVPRKGWIELLDALVGLGRDDVDVRLMAVGDGNADWLVSEATARGVRDRLDVRGVVAPEELPRLYEAADIVVVASHREGFGLVGLEAMAAARPLVSTRVGGLADYVEADVNALVVPVGSGAAIGAAVTRLLGAPALSARLVEAGRTMAARFDTRQLAGGLVRFYERLRAG